MGKIENVKNYSGKDLETIFFRPMLTGPGADELGIRVMYNMPVPTTLHLWKRSGDILQKYTQAGWNGASSASKFQKTINMSKVKAEIGYSADDYFSKVYELITNRPDVNMDDLSGTELEEAETTLFKESIAESIRATMWLGKTSRSTGLNTFDGLLTRIDTDSKLAGTEIAVRSYADIDPDLVEDLIKGAWNAASDSLKALKSQGNLVYFVSTDVYNAYEDHLDSSVLEAAYLAKQEGREGLSYRGVPVVDLHLSGYASVASDLPASFIILTDKRNLALAVNTNDFPGTEVRMWYNPDLMENRQRAIFMAGADYLLPELVSYSYLE